MFIIGNVGKKRNTEQKIQGNQIEKHTTWKFETFSVFNNEKKFDITIIFLKKNN